MDGFQTIKRKLLPYLKGLPIVAICFLAALMLGKMVVNYTPKSYQSIARIKLDDQKFGFSNNALYKDFDVFTTENKIQSEALLLKSPLLVGMALDSVDFGIYIARVGRVRNTTLYGNSPIVVDYDFLDPIHFDQDFLVEVLDEEHYQILSEGEDTTSYPVTPFGMVTELPDGMITIRKNEVLLASRKVDLLGQYQVRIHSRDGLIADVCSRLDVKEEDKEIAVLRVVYKDAHPQKVADLANAICKIYIHDYVQTKSVAARQTLEFLDKKIEDVLQELQEAELALESYKDLNGVVNTRQETETGLRQISNLEVQLINLEMNEKAILDLEQYIADGDYFNETSINFGFGDLLMTELVKKLKLWQDERHDLLIKYTEDSDQVLAVDKKIEEVKNYIVEGIKRNKKEILIKKEQIQASVELASRQFDGLSTREKEMRILERNFHLQEQVYNFLSQKKIEASIAASANLAFHRIIQKAIVPKEATSPNGTLITFVSGLLGLILGIAIIALWKLAVPRINTRADIERNTGLPIAGVVRNENSNGDFDALITGAILKGMIQKGGSIAVSSTIAGEGKSYVAAHLAQKMSARGWSVCFLDINSERPQNELTTDGDLEAFLSDPDNFPKKNLTLTVSNNSNWSEHLTALQSQFDLVIIDTPATALSMEGVMAMKLVDSTFYLLRANKTSTDFADQAERLQEEFQIENIQLVLNDAHRATSYSGNFVGTRFRYNRPTFRLTNYIKTYLR